MKNKQKQTIDFERLFSQDSDYGYIMEKSDIKEIRRFGIVLSLIISIFALIVIVNI